LTDIITYVRVFHIAKARAAAYGGSGELDILKITEGSSIGGRLE